jgi:hypothetical protein
MRRLVVVQTLARGGEEEEEEEGEEAEAPFLELAPYAACQVRHRHRHRHRE